MSPYPVPSIAAALMVLGAPAYSLFTLLKRQEVRSWGKRLLVLVILGLTVCILAAFRDGYVQSVQASVDGSVLPGLFTTGSMPSMVCSIGGGIIAFSALSAVFVRKQTYRRNVFLLVSVTILLKTLVIEVSRAFL